MSKLEVLLALEKIRRRGQGKVENLEGFSTLHNPKFRIIQHYLLLPIQLKQHCSNRVMITSFNISNGPVTEFLMLHFLTSLKIACITWSKVC